MSGTWDPGSGRSRAQSSIVGIVVIIGLTLAIAGSVVVLGGPVLTDAQESVNADQAEQAMTQLDSRASTVSLGDSSRQRVRLGERDDGQVSVESNAGRIEVLTVDDGGSDTIVDEVFGAVVYRTGGTTVAYQGGGVWRQKDGGTVMVSPPEYRYNDNTLTFPIVQVTGDEWVGSPNTPLQLSAGEFEQLFPTDTEGNPLEDGHVHVNVTSAYHQGWKEYFETRTDGVVSHDPANQRVSVNLTVPYTETFDNSVTATSSDGNAVSHTGSPHGGFGSVETGADRPSASSKVDAEVTDCVSGGCQSISGNSFENGTYYGTGEVDVTDATYDTSDGSITIVVDGDLEFAGHSHDITGGSGVTYYVTGDVTVGGNTEVNTGGEASDLHVLAHSDSDLVKVHGTAQLTGFVYAPNTELQIKGGGNPHNDNIVGAVVVQEAHANGNGNVAYEFPEHDGLEFEPIDTITFLHITKNEVEVEGG